MSHVIANRQLSSLIDGELEPLEAAQVEAHLAECPACQAVWVNLIHLVRKVNRCMGDGKKTARWCGGD